MLQSVEIEYEEAKDIVDVAWPTEGLNASANTSQVFAELDSTKEC